MEKRTYGEMIHEAIEKHEKITKDASEKAKNEEENQMNINPDCYVAREIMYQTAVLKNIENMLRQLLKSGME
ncbi:hypothetical protein CS063_16960 [Sporanaerobium hydrogeniformans]|uniref:Uncharacterized protein n=1 Tax=Sporanaerobium hydrogeniformans TaxID=3072179 RepID=A0AC61D971_9FIRM|nr:hypothetical protein [Sporanaerobium hydrogeniformans]PHV69231.1 hypothetical protein CS063_16960 [Sporanaerobium hydrogeniformans]